VVFAAISFYWGSGGTIGVETVWGSTAFSPAQKETLTIAAWITGFLKLVGALLALALVTRWGARLPARSLAVLGWGAAGLLFVYGGTNMVGEALVVSGIVKPTGLVEWKPLLWHLYVWDMSFVIWGILFGLAAWRFTAAMRIRGGNARPQK